MTRGRNEDTQQQTQLDAVKRNNDSAGQADPRGKQMSVELTDAKSEKGTRQTPAVSEDDHLQIPSFTADLQAFARARQSHETWQAPAHTAQMTDSHILEDLDVQPRTKQKSKAGKSRNKKKKGFRIHQNTDAHASASAAVQTDSTGYEKDLPPNPAAPQAAAKASAGKNNRKTEFFKAPAGSAIQNGYENHRKPGSLPADKQAEGSARDSASPGQPDLKASASDSAMTQNAEQNSKRKQADAPQLADTPSGSAAAAAKPAGAPSRDAGAPGSSQNRKPGSKKKKKGNRPSQRQSGAKTGGDTKTRTQSDGSRSPDSGRSGPKGTSDASDASMVQTDTSADLAAFAARKQAGKAGTAPASSNEGSRKAGTRKSGKNRRKTSAVHDTSALDLPVLSVEDTMYGTESPQKKKKPLHTELPNVDIDAYLTHDMLHDSPTEKARREETAKELLRIDQEARAAAALPEKEPTALQKKLRELFGRPWILLLSVGLICLVWLLFDMLRLGLYPFSSLMMTAGLGALALGLAGFFFYFQRKWAGILVAVVLCLALSACSVLGVQKNNGMIAELQKMVSAPNAITNSAGLYYLKQAPVNNVSSLNNTYIGVLSDKNKDLVSRVQDTLAEQDIHIKTKSYDSFTALMRALKGQAVRAVILSSADPLLASEFTGLEQTSDELGLLENFPLDEPRYNTGADKNVRKEPFTMLLCAVNEDMNQERFRSWLTLAISVDPVTRKALLVYIPRSLQLPYACDSETGCAQGDEDKVSLASYHSILTLKDTVAQALNVPIDFTVKINASSLISSLDPKTTIPLIALEGMQALPYGEDQKAQTSIDGVAARRTFASINDFSASDLDYERNQLDLFMALVYGMLQSTGTQNEEGMALLSRCVQTNFTYEQLLGLLQMFAGNGRSWTDYGYGIQGREVWESSASLAAKTFMLQPDTSSLAMAGEDMQAILEGKEPAHAFVIDAKALEALEASLPEQEVPTQEEQETAD